MASQLPHSLLIRQINLSSLELSLALRLTVFKLNGLRLALNHVAYCMLPKCFCILLKESFMLLMLHKNTSYSYHRHFVKFLEPNRHLTMKLNIYIYVHNNFTGPHYAQH